MLRSFASWLNPQPDSLILDVGTGPGLLPAILAQKGFCIIGADLSLAAIGGVRSLDKVFSDASAQIIRRHCIIRDGVEGAGWGTSLNHVQHAVLSGVIPSPVHHDFESIACFGRT